MARKSKTPVAPKPEEHPLDVPAFMKREAAPEVLIDMPTESSTVGVVNLNEDGDVQVTFREPRPVTPGTAVYVELHAMPTEGIDNTRWPVSGRAPYLIWLWGRKFVHLLHVHDLSMVRIKRDHAVLQKAWALDHQTPAKIAAKIRERMVEYDRLNLEYAQSTVERIVTFLSSLPAFGVAVDPASHTDDETSGLEGQMAKRAKKEKKVGGKRASENSLYILKKEPKEGEKIPPQMLGIIACLKKGSGELARSTLVERLPTYLKTRQDAGRILQFYQSRLVDGGFVTIKKPETAAA